VEAVFWSAGATGSIHRFCGLPPARCRPSESQNWSAEPREYGKIHRHHDPRNITYPKKYDGRNQIDKTEDSLHYVQERAKVGVQAIAFFNKNSQGKPKKQGDKYRRFH